MSKSHHNLRPEREECVIGLTGPVEAGRSTGPGPQRLERQLGHVRVLCLSLVSSRVSLDITGISRTPRNTFSFGGGARQAHRRRVFLGPAALPSSVRQKAFRA